MRILKILSTTYTTTLSAKILELLKSGLALLLVPIFFACDDPNLLGIELDDENSKVDAKYIEFTLPISNVYIDSLRTDQIGVGNNQTALFGDYTDSIAGRVRATAYLGYGLGVGQLPNDTLAFSRAFFVAAVNEYIIDGGLSDEVVNVFEADDSLFLSPIYLASTFTPYGSSGIVTSHSFDFVPGIDSVLNIPLSEDLGMFLYDRLDRVSVNDAYEDSLISGLYYYKPLVLEPGAGSLGLYSLDLLDDTTAIYIEMESTTGRNYYFTFDFNTSPHYTYLERDRSVGKLSDLTSEYVESTVISSRVYLNPLTGIHPKIDLQPFINFVDTSENVFINKAEIIMGVAASTISYLDEIEPIQFYFVSDSTRINGPGGFNDNQKLTSAILSEASYYSNSSAHSLLSIGFNSDEDYFRGDITTFSDLFFRANADDQDYLTEKLLLHTPFALSTRRASFIKSEVKMRIYYTKLK